jgi:hypothetical protein
MKQETAEALKQVGDGVSALTAAATLMQWLPAIAALFTIIWTAMRIVEMVTGKEFSVLLGIKMESDDAKRE